MHPANLIPQLLKSRIGLKHSIRAGRVHNQVQELDNSPGLYSLDINLPLGWEAEHHVSTPGHISSEGYKGTSNRGDSWE